MTGGCHSVPCVRSVTHLNRETGKPGDALPYARKIAEVLPDDPGVKRMVAELEGMRP